MMDIRISFLHIRWITNVVQSYSKIVPHAATMLVSHFRDKMLHIIYIKYANMQKCKPRQNVTFNMQIAPLSRWKIALSAFQLY